MPKPKASCNAFYMFMLELQQRLEAQGRRTARGLEDIVDIADEQWRIMDPERKEIYKLRAKEYKQSADFKNKKPNCKPKPLRSKKTASVATAVPSDDELDNFIEPVAHVYPSDDEEAQNEFTKRRLRDRKEMLESWEWNMWRNKDALCEETFYVISFITHGRTAAYDHYPAEVGIVRFSLSEGIISTYSKLLGPHDLPLSIQTVAKQRAAYEHFIPFDTSMPPMTDDFVRVVEEIYRYYRPSPNKYQLFCLAKDFNTVQGSLKYLQTTARMTDISQDRIYCIDDLFLAFCDWKKHIPIPNEWLCYNDCYVNASSDPVLNSPHLSCDFHSSRGSIACALTKAKRIAYTTLRLLRGFYDIPTSGNHVPPPVPANVQIPLLANAEAYWRPKIEEARRQALEESRSEKHDDLRVADVIRSFHSVFSETASVGSRMTVVTNVNVNRKPSPELSNDDEWVYPLSLPNVLKFLSVPKQWMEIGRSQRALASASTNIDPKQLQLPETTIDPKSSTARDYFDNFTLFAIPTNVRWNQTRYERNYIYNIVPNVNDKLSPDEFHEEYFFGDIPKVTDLLNRDAKNAAVAGTAGCV